MNTLNETMTKKLSGPEKACIMMITMGESRSKNILNQLDQSDIEIISNSMKNLGKVSSSLVEKVINVFNEKISYINKPIQEKNTENNKDQTLWTKLEYVNEEILSKYIQNEHPQTAAIILQKINSTRAGKIIDLLPDELASEIITRIAKTKPIKSNILTSIEQSLSRDILSSMENTNTQDKNINSVMEIIKNTSHQKSKNILGYIKNKNPKISSNLDNLIFKFDDFNNQDEFTIRKIIENTDHLTITKALRGCSSEVINKFLDNMDDLSAKSLNERLKKIGPIKIKEVDAAQCEIVSIAKKLENKNIIELN